MATCKLVFRVSSCNNSEGTLYFRVIHHRKVKHIHTGCKLNVQEWDDENCCVITGFGSVRDKYLGAVRVKIREVGRRIRSIIDILGKMAVDYSVEDIVERYYDDGTVVGMLSFIRSLMADCKKLGRYSAVTHYNSVINQLLRFHGGNEIGFDEIDDRFVERFEDYMRGMGLCPNTTSYYMRKLRAVYNMAAARGLVPERNIFRYVYTGVAKTVKRAVSLEVIRQLKALDLRDAPLDALARDMFLFSFYTRGMSTVDMSYLRKKDLRNGVLTYRRRKTSQLLTIKWERPMDEIANRYSDSESGYLLPLIKLNGGNERRQYLNASHLLNRHLKNLGVRIGLSKPLTMYVARHAWASIALDNDVPISLISQGMGHDSEATTRIYLATLDQSKLDRANNELLRLLD